MEKEEIDLITDLIDIAFKTFDYGVELLSKRPEFEEILSGINTKAKLANKVLTKILTDEDFEELINGSEEEKKE